MGFDTSPAKFLQLCERFNEYFHEGLHECDLWPGVRETLAFVKDSGKTQSLLSASEHSLLLRSIDQFQVTKYFDHVVGIFDKTAGSKVDRGRELLNKVGIPKSETILIGDTDHDLEVAQALGIELLLVEHGHQCPTRLHAVHTKVVNIFTK